MFVRNLAAFVLLFLVSVSTSLQAQTPVTQADIPAGEIGNPTLEAGY